MAKHFVHIEVDGDDSGNGNMAITGNAPVMLALYMLECARAQFLSASMGPARQISVPTGAVPEGAAGAGARAVSFPVRRVDRPG